MSLGDDDIPELEVPSWQKPITDFFPKVERLPAVNPVDVVEMEFADDIEMQQESKENTPPVKADEQMDENSNDSATNKRALNDDDIAEKMETVPKKKRKL